MIKWSWCVYEYPVPTAHKNIMKWMHACNRLLHAWIWIFVFIILIWSRFDIFFSFFFWRSPTLVLQTCASACDINLMRLPLRHFVIYSVRQFEWINQDKHWKCTCMLASPVHPVSIEFAKKRKKSNQTLNEERRRISTLYFNQRTPNRRQCEIIVAKASEYFFSFSFST